MLLTTIKNITKFLMIFLAVSHVTAQNDKFFLESGTGDAGEVITLGVFVQDISGNVLDTVGLDGFLDFGMKITFDPALVSSIAFVQTGLSQTQPPLFFTNLNDLPPGEAQFLCSYLFPVPLTLDGPAELFCELQITPSNAAAGQTISFGFNDADTFIVGTDGGTVEMRDSLGNLDVTIGSVTVTGTGGSAPVIGSFAASPATITEGVSSTLSWSVTDADSVSIDQGVGSVSASGNTDVSPTETTTYTISATNQFGTSTDTVTVTVVAQGQPQIGSFEAFPTQIVAGGSSALSWETTDADTVTITPNIGEVATSGSTNVSPTAETTYTLTASNGAGDTTAQVTVDVVEALSIDSFTASPSQVEEGGSSTLSWSVTGASNVTLDGASVNATGSQSVTPAQTTTYTLAATGPLNQSAEETVTVRVAGDTTLALDLSTIDFGTDDTSVDVLLSVNAPGVFSWAIDGLPHWLQVSPADSGTVDGERATELTISVDRTRLFPGQAVNADLTFTSEGILGASLSVAATRAESADETYLYFPLIQADADRRGEMTVVNHATEEAQMTLQLFQQDGTLLGDPITETLAVNGSYHVSPSGSQVNGVIWAVATLTSDSGAPQASGCVSVRSNDGEELYGLSAETEKGDFLYVPHIAGDTNVFFTNSSVVNLANQNRTSSVDTGAGFEIASQDSGTQAFFSYEDVLGGAIQNLTWSRITFDTEIQNAAIGAEVFGFKDFQRTVGVGLNQKAYNELYFVHIAEDLASFWTGVVVINLAETSADITFEPYNSNGELIDGGFTQTFEAGEKHTFVVLGEREDFGPNAAWVKVTSPSPVTGFELFANPAGTAGDTFAGLEAAGVLSRKLAFCHTEEGSGGLTGVALINPGEVAANLTFHLVAQDGTIKETANTGTLDPKQKLISIANNIFTQAEIAFGDIILVDSDQEIAGFELYGDFTGSLGALLATPIAE